MKLPFFIPDITEEEIASVAEVLRSGWITTGPVTKRFEEDINSYCGVKRTACLSSATAAMELSLRILGVGEGDEVITSAYTYSASASVIAHVGATIVLADTVKGGLAVDPESVAEKITRRTKAVIPVDIGGVPVDYRRLREVVEQKRELFRPNGDMQKGLGRAALIGDAAHSFGAKYLGGNVAECTDICCFSFHAVKNLTTAEGGCACFGDVGGVGADEIYKKFMLLSLHGQDKDALAKTNSALWEYDILLPAYKFNMPDILAAVGAAQLRRYDEMLAKRRALTLRMNGRLAGTRMKPIIHEAEDYTGSYHAYIVRVDGFEERDRNRLIDDMQSRGVTLNVHFKPLPLMTAYKNLGFVMADYPNAYDYYKAAVTLPLFSKMSVEEADFVADNLLDLISMPGYRYACP